MQKLQTLLLNDNPAVVRNRQYRQELAAAMPNLRYLDQKPIFEFERGEQSVSNHSVNAGGDDSKSSRIGRSNSPTLFRLRTQERKASINYQPQPVNISPRYRFPGQFARTPIAHTTVTSHRSAHRVFDLFSNTAHLRPDVQLRHELAIIAPLAKAPKLRLQYNHISPHA